MNAYTRPGARRSLAVLTAAAATVALGACGSDDSKSDSASPQDIAITSAGTLKGPTFTAPATAKAGAAKLTFTNGTSGGDTMGGQLAYVTGTHTDAQIKAQLANAQKSKPVASWFQGGGGPADVPKGKSSTETQELKAGTYYVLGSGDNPPAGKLATIKVSGDGGSALPKAAGEVDASEYTFRSKGIAAGKPVLLANEGRQWHHFLADRLAPGATTAQVKKFFLSNGKGAGKPPIEGNPQRAALESTVMDPGVKEVVTAPKKPGRYVFFCFVSDKQGGPPHIAKGMIHVVTVK